MMEMKNVCRELEFILPGQDNRIVSINRYFEYLPVIMDFVFNYSNFRS